MTAGTSFKISNVLLTTATLLCSVVGALLLWPTASRVLERTIPRNAPAAPAEVDSHQAHLAQFFPEPEKQTQSKDVPYPVVSRHITRVAENSRPQSVVVDTAVPRQTPVNPVQFQVERTVTTEGVHAGSARPMVYVPVTVHPVTVNVDNSGFAAELARVSRRIEQLTGTETSEVPRSTPADTVDGKTRLDQIDERLSQLNDVIGDLAEARKSAVASKNNRNLRNVPRPREVVYYFSAVPQRAETEPATEETPPTDPSTSTSLEPLTPTNPLAGIDGDSETPRLSQATTPIAGGEIEPVETIPLPARTDDRQAEMSFKEVMPEFTAPSQEFAPDPVVALPEPNAFAEPLSVTPPADQPPVSDDEAVWGMLDPPKVPRPVKPPVTKAVPDQNEIAEPLLPETLRNAEPVIRFDNVPVAKEPVAVPPIQIPIRIIPVRPVPVDSKTVMPAPVPATETGDDKPPVNLFEKPADKPARERMRVPEIIPAETTLLDLDPFAEQATETVELASWELPNDRHDSRSDNGHVKASFDQSHRSSVAAVESMGIEFEDESSEFAPQPIVPLATAVPLRVGSTTRSGTTAGSQSSTAGRRTTGAHQKPPAVRSGGDSRGLLNASLRRRMSGVGDRLRDPDFDAPHWMVAMPGKRPASAAGKSTALHRVTSLFRTVTRPRTVQ
jgi:hypothetical protein